MGSNPVSSHNTPELTFLPYESLEKFYEDLLMFKYEKKKCNRVKVYYIYLYKYKIIIIKTVEK